MKDMDGRRRSHEALEEVRIRAGKPVEAGESPEMVIDALGFHRSAICKWISLYREGGAEALKGRKAPGSAPKLDGKRLRRLCLIITSKNPLQLGFEFALWTRAMIREVIRDQFGVSVGRLLREACQRDEEKVQAWRKQAYAKIQKLAKKEGATVYFGDEASTSSGTHDGTTWTPTGETPVIETPAARFSTNKVSAVSAKGQLRFMSFEGRMNADRFIEFLKRLTYRATTRVFLILEGHPVHKSKPVKDYVASTEGRLRLFILPPYSPHLSPDDSVWNGLKRHQIGKDGVAGPGQLRTLADRSLRSLQKLPVFIRGLFADPNLAYLTQAWMRMSPIPSTG